MINLTNLNQNRPILSVLFLLRHNSSISLDQKHIFRKIERDRSLFIFEIDNLEKAIFYRYNHIKIKWNEVNHHVATSVKTPKPRRYDF